MESRYIYSQLLGSAYGNLEKYENAFLDYTKVIEIDPHNCEVYILRGILLMNYLGISLKYLGRKEDALKDFTKSIQIRSN